MKEFIVLLVDAPQVVVKAEEFLASGNGELIFFRAENGARIAVFSSANILGIIEKGYLAGGAPAIE